MAKVSICVPVYNVEKYIARCLESILSQSYENIEVIVVNDCTPDKSMDIVKSYAEKDQRIRIINHGTNRGLMWTRRTGYMAATGDYITFCDSDDTLPEDAIKDLYSAAVTQNADIVSGIIQYIPVDGVSYLWNNLLSNGTDRSAVYNSLLSKEFGHNLCSRLFRREILQGYDYITYENATNGEDGMLFYQVIANVSKVICIDQVVYLYYQNFQSSSNIRLNEQSLQNIVRANRIRVDTTSKYVSTTQSWKYVSQVFNSLIAEGYNRKGTLCKILRTEGMEEYISIIKMLNYFSLSECCLIIFKRVFYPIIHG